MVLFFLVTLSCEEEAFIDIPFKTPVSVNAKTVSFEEAKNFFIQKKNQINFLNKETNPLIVSPDWNSLSHREISCTDALLTKADTNINRKGDYTSELFFIYVDGEIKNVIFTIWKDKVDENGLVINARVFFNQLDGTFIDAYKIENGKFAKRLVPKKKIEQAGFLILLQSNESDPDCWNTDTLDSFEGGVLTEVVLSLNASSSGGGGGGSGAVDPSIPSVGDYYNNPGTNVNDSNPSGGGSQNGGNSATKEEIIDDAATILVISPNESNTCPEGYIKDTEGNCISTCSPTKVYNTITKKCECPSGYIENTNRECVKKPCKKDPVPNPEIAPQYGSSGAKGALFGCTRYGGSCVGTDGRNKSHAGIDLKSNYGDPIYAMYDGFIFSTKYDSDGAGYYTRIQSTVNGKTFIHEYYHMQKENRVLQGNPLVQVKAGDIIGYQGDSGNLKGAITAGTVDSHVHIEIKEHNGTNKWSYANFNPVDPRDYFSTTINEDGISQSNTNCN